MCYLCYIFTSFILEFPKNLTILSPPHGLWAKSAIFLIFIRLCTLFCILHETNILLITFASLIQFIRMQIFYALLLLLIY